MCCCNTGLKRPASHHTPAEGSWSAWPSADAAAAYKTAPASASAQGRLPLPLISTACHCQCRKRAPVPPSCEPAAAGSNKQQPQQHGCEQYRSTCRSPTSAQHCTVPLACSRHQEYIECEDVALDWATMHSCRGLGAISTVSATTCQRVNAKLLSKCTASLCCGLQLAALHVPEDCWHCWVNACAEASVRQT